MHAFDPRQFAAAPPFMPDGLEKFLSMQGLSEFDRLIRLDTSLGSDGLIVDRFSGREAISELFRFEVDCIARTADKTVQALLGEEVGLHLHLADGTPRSFHGMVTQIQSLESDGLPRYRLTLEPWLQLLAFRRDSYVFQNKSLLDIVADVLGDYSCANYRFDVNTSLPARSLVMQYRESDYDFIKRLLADEGLNFYFAHAVDSGSPVSGDHTGRARHQLIVFDDNTSLAACAQATIRYHRADATEATDSITQFTQCKQITANAVALAGWDYKKLAPTTSPDRKAPLSSACPQLEIYAGTGAYRYSSMAEGDRIANVRTDTLALAQQRMHAESSARSLAVGTWFTLTQHPDANGEYILLSIAHAGANNLPSLNAAPTDPVSVERGTYRNQFTCVPRAVRIRPEHFSSKPSAPGVQVALVVGVAGEDITADRDHRIKVQFPWQRGDCATSGQLPHPAGSNASGNETAGTWVRVAEPCAGANWGAHFIPRLGQKVLLEFIRADIDRPVITGQLYNGDDTPPLHGADNHPGALTGIRTKEIAGSGANQWVIDDTPGQLRQTLTSSSSASRFHAGYPIGQDGNLRGSFRGTGF